MLLLLNYVQEILKIPHDISVHSEHARVDHLGTHKLDQDLKKGDGKVNSVWYLQDIGVSKLWHRYSPDDCGIRVGVRRCINPMRRGMLTKDKRLDPLGEVIRVAHSHTKGYNLFE